MKRFGRDIAKISWALTHLDNHFLDQAVYICDSKRLQEELAAQA